MKRAFYRYWASRGGKFSFLLLGLGLLLVLIGPHFTSATSQDAGSSLLPPTGAHWFGTDSLGRDLFARVVEGARLSFLVGLFAALVSLLVGLAYGGLAGMAGRRTEAFLLRAADLLYSLPVFLVTALLLLFMGRGPVALILALGLTSWVGEARLVRALVRQAKTMPYVESAESSGLPKFRIFWRHILPNVIGPVLVSVAIGVPANILNESFLSFVGLGLEAPFASLGTLASDGWRGFRSYPHLILFPGGALFFLVFLFTIAGDVWRDAIDPR